MDNTEIEKIESHIANHKMISLGTRKNSRYGALIKCIGWSQGLKKEIGKGYEVIVINSLGEQFCDLESENAIFEVLHSKGFSDAKYYIEKMADINEELLEKIRQNPDADYVNDFADLMAYFWIIRWILEKVYEKSPVEEQKYMDEWRNLPTTAFPALMLYSKLKDNESKETDNGWTVASVDGGITQVNKVISREVYVKDTQSEIRGRIGYPGMVRGRARVVVSSEDRDAIEDGEIIIAPMTTLDFLPAMKKAIAFVTDEGGVTCHAAIVAREMKKPCIIGTKNGSKVISTGDVIEVDATGVEGVVRIV